jgi:hypothetical protein
MKTPVVTTILTEVLVTVHLEADMHHPLLNRLSCRSSELKAILILQTREHGARIMMTQITNGSSSVTKPSQMKS